MGIRFKQVILKGFLRLSIQPVLLGGVAARAGRARKKTHQPSNTITMLDPIAPFERNPRHLVCTIVNKGIQLCTLTVDFGVGHSRAY